MATSVASGPARVVSTGIVTAFAGHDLTFVLSEPEAVATIVLGFRSDAAIDDVDVRAAAFDGGLRLDLVNFDKPDGRGSAEPVLLGPIGDDTLWLHFRVFRYGRTEDRTVHFTFYRVAPAVHPG